MDLKFTCILPKLVVKSGHLFKVLSTKHYYFKIPYSINCLIKYSDHAFMRYYFNKKKLQIIFLETIFLKKKKLYPILELFSMLIELDSQFDLSNVRNT